MNFHPLSPSSLEENDFFLIYVKNNHIEENVRKYIYTYLTSLELSYFSAPATTGTLLHSPTTNYKLSNIIMSFTYLDDHHTKNFIHHLCQHCIYFVAKYKHITDSSKKDDK